MRICIDARPAVWYKGTGIGNYADYLVRTMVQMRQSGIIDDELFLLWPSEDDPVPGTGPGISYKIMPEKRRSMGAIVQWAASERIDVYHAPQNGFHAPLDIGCRLVVTVHDLIPFVLPEAVGKSYLARFLDRMPAIVERADRVLTVSRAAGQDLARILGVPWSKIRVVHSAPDPSLARVPRDVARDLVSRKYGIADPYILYVGGLNPRKNVGELIYAYSKVEKKLPGLQDLVIAGEPGRMEQRLKGLAHSLDLDGRVVFPGFIEPADMAALYSAADLFVYPSIYEGFGLPPIEAMTCGVPVITSTASSIPEVVGDAATAVDAGDTAALAAAILEVLSNPALAESLRRRGFERARMYSWEKSAREIHAVYREFA